MVQPKTPPATKAISTVQVEHNEGQDCQCNYCISRQVKPLAPKKPSVPKEEGPVLGLRFNPDIRFGHTASPGCTCDDCVIKRGKLISELNSAEDTKDDRSPDAGDIASSSHSEVSISSEFVCVSEDESTKVVLNRNKDICQCSESPSKSTFCSSLNRNCLDN